MTPAAVLERAGFSIRGNRATCPFCDGNRRLTVALHGELYFCHRCHRGGNIRSLAHGPGVRLLAPRIRRADRPKAEFRVWLAAKMSEIAKLERTLYRRAELAKAALAQYPDMEAAWSVLADWYHARRRCATFWQSASDKIGRYWLYRAWRHHARA